jgi:hypothetical protein
VPYLDYLAPGIIAQSAMFIAIFYGIMIIWERDAGVLTKLLVTPTPRAALITGKAFASGTKALIQAVVVMIFAAILGVGMTANPLKILGVAVLVVLGSAFFSCLSMSIAGIVLTRDRLMGIGQAITMPLFFSSSALYPTSVMPGWLQPISAANTCRSTSPSSSSPASCPSPQPPRCSRASRSDAPSLAEQVASDRRVARERTEHDARRAPRSERGAKRGDGDEHVPSGAYRAGTASVYRPCEPRSHGTDHLRRAPPKPIATVGEQQQAAKQPGRHA